MLPVRRMKTAGKRHTAIGSYCNGRFWKVLHPSHEALLAYDAGKTPLSDNVGIETTCCGARAADSG
jgi:hypothetical protein